MKEPINSKQDMQKMQQDAIRRVREMQARAKHTLERSKVPCGEGYKTENAKNQNFNNKKERQKKERFENNRQSQSRGHEKQKKEPPIGAPPHKRYSDDKNPKSNSIDMKNINGIISSLLKDQEKALILALILVLMSEEDNLGLMLALASLII